MDLKLISEEIRNALQERRAELGLEFFEDEHRYIMRDTDGSVHSNFPSVSKVVKLFYTPFDAEGKSYQMAQGDLEVQQQLLEKWRKSGEYSTNMGSRVHYILENELVSQYGDYKDVREPIFECDSTQILRSDKMVEAGKNFLDLMHERGAVLLDTEIVLGDPDLGYTGQPDKVWLMMNKNQTGFGMVITDWKTNQPKNFQIHSYTGKMLHPFGNYHDTALGHYYLQLPLYGKLILKMLENSKYSDLKLLGCVVVLVKDDGSYEEFKVPYEVTQTILNMDIKKYLN